MRHATLTEWKQFMNAITDRTVEGITQENRQLGSHSVREYWALDTVVARMYVYGANTDAPGHENQRDFFLHPMLDVDAFRAPRDVWDEETGQWEVQ